MDITFYHVSFCWTAPLSKFYLVSEYKSQLEGAGDIYTPERTPGHYFYCQSLIVPEWELPLFFHILAVYLLFRLHSLNCRTV